MPIRLECPLWRLDDECDWTWTLPEMPEDYHATVQLTDHGGIRSAALPMSQTVRESLWLRDHEGAAHVAISEHLRTQHDLDQLIEHVAWEPLTEED